MVSLVDLNGNILFQGATPTQPTGIVDRFGQSISSKPILEMTPSEKMDSLIKRYGNFKTSTAERQAVTDTARIEYQKAQGQYQKALAKHQRMVQMREEAQARIQKLTVNSTPAEVKEAYGKFSYARKGVEKSSAELSKYADAMKGAQAKVNEAAVESMRYQTGLGKLRQELNNAAIENVESKLSTKMPVNESIINQRLGIGREAVSAADSASAFIERGVTVNENFANMLAEHAENIAKNKDTIAQQGARIAEQSGQLSDAAAKISEQGQQLADAGKKMAEQGAKIGQLKKALTWGIVGVAVVGIGLGIWALLSNRKKNEQIAEQQNAEAANQERIAELEQQLADCQEQQAVAETEQPAVVPENQDDVPGSETYDYTRLAVYGDNIWNYCAEQLTEKLGRTPTDREVFLTSQAYREAHNIPLINNWVAPLQPNDTLWSIPKLPEIFPEG